MSNHQPSAITTNSAAAPVYGRAAGIPPPCAPARLLMPASRPRAQPPAARFVCWFSLRRALLARHGELGASFAASLPSKYGAAGAAAPACASSACHKQREMGQRERSSVPRLRSTYRSNARAGTHVMFADTRRSQPATAYRCAPIRRAGRHAVMPQRHAGAVCRMRHCRCCR